MATPDPTMDDIFQLNGRLRLDLLTDDAVAAIRESLHRARETHWDSVRSPHLFMGLLAAPDAGVRNWGDRLKVGLPRLLAQFQELFHQDTGEAEPVLALNREFLSDNVIRLLRESLQRAAEHHRPRVTPLDLLITMLTASNSVVADCFESIGVTAEYLTRLAVMAEQQTAAG